MISLIGMGSGCPESLTAQGLAALQSAGLILGARRLLEHLPAGCTDNCKNGSRCVIMVWNNTTFCWSRTRRIKSYSSIQAVYSRCNRPFRRGKKCV